MSEERCKGGSYWSKHGKKEDVGRQRSIAPEGDFVREYKDMDEDNFLSSWLREDTEGEARRSGGNEKERVGKIV